MAEKEVAPQTPEAAPAQAATDAKQGPGAQALEALLKNGAQPDHKKVIAIIDGHRGERDQLFAMLQSSCGNAYVQAIVSDMEKLRLSLDRKEIAAGDPSNPQGGYFVAGQEQQGARWRTAGGGFAGRADKDGLDTTVKTGEHDAIHAQVGKDQHGTIAWERDGKSQGELFGHYKSGTDYEGGVRKTWGLDGGAQITGGAHHQVTGAGATDGVFGSYKSSDGKTTGDAALGVQGGGFAGTLGGSHTRADGSTISGRASHDSTGTTLSGGYKDKDTTLGAHVGQSADGTTSAGVSGSQQLASGATVAGSLEAARTRDGIYTGSLGGTYSDKDTKLDGSITRGAHDTTGTLGATQQVNPQLSLTGRLTHQQPDQGQGQTTLSLSEQYRSGKVVQGLDLTAGGGQRDYVGLTGSMEAQLAPKLYAGAYGSYGAESGKPATAQLGASLTFTPNEKTALTLAGIVDEHGTVETRLQLDVFKSKVSNVADLSTHKKDALVSLFVSYQQDTSRHMLDSRFGAPQYSAGTGGGQVMGGLKINF